MPSEVDLHREMARAFWRGDAIECPKHPGVQLAGTFVQTTYKDHIFLTCSRGKETITIPQRPRQTEFQAQQVEGFVENIQRGDSILCYRCQSPLEVDAKENPENGITDYTFTCVRCLSFGRWLGHPASAQIGQPGKKKG